MAGEAMKIDGGRAVVALNGSERDGEPLPPGQAYVNHSVCYCACCEGVDQLFVGISTVQFALYRHVRNSATVHFTLQWDSSATAGLQAQ